MKNQIRSTDNYRSQHAADAYNRSEMVVEPDIAGHEARQALNRAKKVRIAVISAVICILVIASAVFALYTSTDLFKSKGGDIDIDKDDDGVTRLTMVDTAAFEQVKNGDYSAFNGLDVSRIAEFKPFLIGYNLVIEDESIARVISGKLYGLRPGVTKVRVYAQDGSEVASFDIEVLDSKGNLYYNVTFDFPGNDDVTYRVMSGKSLRDSGFEIPSLPARTGFTAVCWALDGERFFDSEIITDNVTLTVNWDAIPVSFDTLPVLTANYREFYEFSFSEYASAGTGTYAYRALTALPAGMSLSSSGRLSGYPSNVVIDDVTHEVLSYQFDIEVADSVNNTLDTATIRFKVLPRVVTVMFSNYSDLIYNGEVRTIKASITNLAPEDVGQVSAVLDYGGGRAGVKDANTYTATLSGLTGARAFCYTLSTTTYSQTFSIAPMQAEIRYYTSNANDQNFDLVYNAKAQTVMAEVTNLFDGDTCQVYLGYDREDSERINVQEGLLATAVSLSNPNYVIKSGQLSKAFNIIPAQLTVTVNPASKIYGQSDPAFTMTLEGAQSDAEGRSEETMLRAILSACFQRVAGENVGTYSVNVNPSVSMDDALDNYSITANASILTVLSRDISIIVSSEINKPYDGTATVYINDNAAFETFNSENATGLKAGDDLSFAGIYVDANGTEVVNASTDFIRIRFTLGGASAANYNLVGDYQGKINKFIITDVSGITAKDKVFDGNMAAEIIYTDATLSGRNIPLNGVTAVFETPNVGQNLTVYITNVSLDPQYTSNYAVSADDIRNITVRADINPRPVYIKAGTVFNKVYDGAAEVKVSALEFEAADAFSGIVDGRALQIAGTYLSVFVGDSIELQLALTAESNPFGNYVLAGSYQGSITKRNVFVDGDIIKTYDSFTAVNKTGLSFRAADAATGLVSGDEAFVDFAGNYLDKNVGTAKAVNMYLTGTRASNYNLVFDRTGVIETATLTIAVVNNLEKEYDNQIYSAEISALLNSADITVAGLQGSDAITGGRLVSADGKVNFAGTVQAKALAVSGLVINGNNDANNYELIFSGSVTIKQKEIVLSTFTVSGKTYDGTDVATVTGYTVDGFLAGDDAGISITRAVFEDKNEGSSKTVTVLASDIIITGTDAGNYYIDISESYNITSAIYQKTLTVTGDFEKTYDGTADVESLTVDGIISGDDVTYTAQYAQTGMGDSVKIEIMLAGTDSGNYRLGDLYGKIARKALTLSGDFTKPYDGTKSVLPASFTVSGVIAGDTVDVTADYDSANVGVSKVVTAAIASTGDYQNYTLPVSSYAGRIDALPITIDLDAYITANSIVVDKTYNGTGIEFSLAGYTDGLLPGDYVSAGRYGVDKNAGTKSFVNLESIVISNVNGAVTANYDITVITAAATISQKDLGITIPDFEKTYDGTTSVTLDINYDKIAGDEFTVLYTAALADKNAGNGLTATVNITVEGKDAANYSYTATVSVTGNVLQKGLTVVGEAGISDPFDKTYDGEDTVLINNRLRLYGILTGDDVSFSGAAYSQANAGENLMITFGALEGADKDNYDIAGSYTGTINKLVINGVDGITAEDKIYDGGLTATVDTGSAVLNGVLPADAGELTLLYSSAAFAIADASNEIELEVTVKGMYLTSISGVHKNYKIADNLTFTAYAKILQREIKIVPLLPEYTAKVYDGTPNIDKTRYAFAALDATTGVIAADINYVGFELVFANGQKDVGTDLSISITLTGAKKDNYIIIETYKGEITQREITSVSGIVIDDKDYDGTTDFVPDSADFEGAVYGNIVSGDTVGFTFASAAYSAKDFGARTVVFSGITLTNANYKLSDGLVVSAPAKIVPKAVTIIADDFDKVYDGTDAVIDAMTVEGAIGGDTLTASAVYVNGYNIGLSPVAVTLSGDNNVNYTVDGSYFGTISKRPIDVAFDREKVYDGAGVTFSYTTLQPQVAAGDVIRGEKTFSKNVGEYTLSDAAWTEALSVKSDMTGEDRSANYEFTYSVSVNITPKALSFNAEDEYFKTYDGTVNFSATLNPIGVVEGDNVIVTTSITLTSKDVGTDTQTVNIVFGGTDLNNYSYDGLSTIDIIVTVRPKDILIVPKPGAENATTKVYDGSKTLDTAKLMLDGVIATDDISFTAEFVSPNAYEIMPLPIIYTVAGTDKDNYNIVGGPMGYITKAELTVSGTLNKVYDGTNSADVAGITLNNVIGEDDVIIASATYSSKNVGTRILEFTLGGVKAGNYILNPVNAKITARELTIDIGEIVPKVYDGNNITVDIASLTGLNLAPGQSITGTRVTEYSHVGTPKFVEGVPVSILDAGDNNVKENYEITYTVRYAEITPKPLTVIVTASDKMYDGTAKATISFSYNGLEYGDEVYAEYASAAFETTDVGEDIVVNVTGITLNGDDAINYQLVNETATATADITKTVITVITGFTARDKIYDGTNSAEVDVSLLNYYSGETPIEISSSDMTMEITGAEFSSSNKGNWTVTITSYNLIGDKWNNYYVLPGAKLRETLSTMMMASITPRTIYIDRDASDFDKLYDGTNRVIAENIVFAAPDYENHTGIVAVDADTVKISSDSYYTTGAWITTDTPITFILENNDDGNYVLNTTPAIKGNILQKTVYIVNFEASEYNKIYDGSRDIVNGSMYLTGVVAGDESEVTLLGTYADKNVGIGIDITFSLTGAKAVNYSLHDTGKTGDITQKVLTVEDIYEGVISMAYNGTTKYTGEFEQGVHYRVSESVNAEAITVTVVSCNYNAVYVSTANSMTAVFELKNDNPINANYLLQTTGEPSTIVSLVYDAVITQKINNPVLTINVDAQVYMLDENHKAYIPDTNLLLLNLDYGPYPVGMSVTGEVHMYELFAEEGSNDRVVDYGGTPMYYSSTNPIVNTPSGYDISAGAGTNRIYVVISEPDNNPVRYDEITPENPLYDAYSSMRLEFITSFILVFNL